MTPWTNIIDWLEWNHPFQPYFHFLFITFSFGCATPFCRNQPFAQSELETTLWKVWFFLPFFLPVPFFFDADITILQGWATYASVHSWLTHSLCSGLFSDWTVFCLLQSQFKPGMSRFGFAILHWLSDGCLAFVPTFGFALFPYHYRFTCFPFSIIAFYRSNHHFSSAKIVCRRERHGCLDQWRSRFNLPLSSLRFYLWLKIKRIDALSLVHPLNDIYFLGSVKIDLITSKSNSTWKRLKTISQ